MACNHAGAVCNRCGRALTPAGAARAGGCPRRNGGADPALAAVAAKAAADAASAAVLNAQGTGCASTGASLPNAAVMYNTPVTAAAICADCYDMCGSHRCNLQNRSTFWPRFAHPRWLTCAQLYSRRCR